MEEEAEEEEEVQDADRAWPDRHPKEDKSAETVTDDVQPEISTEFVVYWPHELKSGTHPNNRKRQSRRGQVVESWLCHITTCKVRTVSSFPT